MTEEWTAMSHEGQGLCFCGRFHGEEFRMAQEQAWHEGLIFGREPVSDGLTNQKLIPHNPYRSKTTPASPELFPGTTTALNSLSIRSEEN